MGNKYSLAVDIGASSGRHILSRMEDGKIVLEEVYRFWNGNDKKDGHLVWDMDALVEDVLERFGQMEVLDGELLTEDAVDIALGIVDGDIALANDDEAVAAGNGVVGDTAGGICGNGVTGYGL